LDKWLFKVELHANNNIEKYKVRLIAKTFSQIFIFDYMDTFLLIVKGNSIKIILALAAQYDWEIHQLYVKTTFLNEIFKEEIYLHNFHKESRNPKIQI